MKVKVTEEDYRRMCFGLGTPGMCLSCGYLDEYAGCEPDAECYECPECGENKLYGLEQAFIMGHVEIT